MTDSVVQQFARHLAGLDEHERSRSIARAKMIAMKEAPEESFEPPIRTLEEYLATPIIVPPTVIEPYLVVRGGLNATLGRAGKGKTVMNLNRIIRWAAGDPMFKGWNNPEDGLAYYRPEKPIKTLIVENEGAAGMFHRQVGLMLNAGEFVTDAQKRQAEENIFVWGEGGYSGLKLDDPAKLDGLRAGVEQWEPDLVFVEPFRSLWSGEENSSTEMSVVVDNLIGLATDYECGVILSHHERKSGPGEDGEKMSAGRGSTVLEGAATLMENFESVKNNDYREMTVSKSRHHVGPAPVRMSWVEHSWWYRWVPLSDLEESILGGLRDNGDEPLTVSSFSELLSESEYKVRQVLDRLVAEGRVVRMPSEYSGSGSTGFRYRLPTGGPSAGGADF